MDPDPIPVNKHREENEEVSFDFDNNPTWRIFRIMAEFVEGFTFIARFQKSVTFFGSARLAEDHPYYKLAREMGKRLAEKGYSIVTGGGPGIMQAGNQGAFEAGGNSVGLNIQLPSEQRVNPYVKQSMNFNYFFSRKTMLGFSAEAYIFFPGGFGTLDEFFDLITLFQTGKMDKNTPIIMMGSAFWGPLIGWMKQVMRDQLQTIGPKDLEMWLLTDDIEEAVRAVEAGVQKQTEQRVARKGRAHKTPDDKIQQATRPMRGSEQ